MDKRKVTAARRSEIARKAAAARWGTSKPKQLLRTVADMEHFCNTVSLSGNLPPELYENASGDVMQVAAARAMHIIQLGLEVGLQPAQALSSICVLDGKPLINGDAMLALVLNSGKADYVHESFEGDGDNLTAVCVTHRRGDSAGHVSRFSVQDAIAAGLWGKAGTWTTHGPRMLKYKARAFCLRDKYPDVLKGLAHSIEEMQGEVVKQRYDTDIAPHDAANKLIGIVNDRMLHKATTKGEKL